MLQMASIVAFSCRDVLLGLGIASRAIPEAFVANVLGYLHKTIGITTPSPEQVRMIALIWIGATVLIVDGCLFFLVFVTSLLN